MTKGKFDKIIKDLIGVGLYESRFYIQALCNGCEESINTIKFIYKGWVISVYFEKNICIEVTAKNPKFA